MKLNHRFNFPLRRTKQGAGWAARREETVEDRDNTSVSKGRYRPRRGLSGLKPSLAQIWTGLSLSQRCTWSFAFGYLLGLRKAFPSFTVLIIYDGLKVASWEHTGFKKKQNKKNNLKAPLNYSSERGGGWREVGRGSLGRSPGEGSSVGLTVQWRTGQVSRASCFSRLQHQLFSPALTPDPVPSCSLKLRRQKKKAARRRVKSTAAYCVCVEETLEPTLQGDEDLFTMEANWKQSSSMHWSITRLKV